MKLLGAKSHQSMNFLMVWSHLPSVSTMCAAKEITQEIMLQQLLLQAQRFCKCGNVKQVCSAEGCQQQYCCDCALDADKHQCHDFTFCSSECFGETMYRGDHNHLLKPCCQCDIVICHEGTQECPCCEETLCEDCSNSGSHELECRAGQWDGQASPSRSDKAFVAGQLWQEGLLYETW